ncbi:DMT family transporter [Planosporangium mesophilum]|uniref:Membrane protein n=1 Tax=Planosporangium mesophilum TaxID=689768 RepID=A0A8J3TD60_9ACTN|nr:DMT family transporter [Planosporangium mesophilum]NJC82829.1 DMT family transporter [Planosporangium mesophilum]GII23702.1 membrane protein [Planosporangium mesophilum]
MSRRAWLQLLTLAALWGAVYPLIAVALQGFSPVAVVFGRVALAALLLTPLAVHRNALRPLWKHPRAIIETVLVQSTAPLLLLAFGQQHVGSGLAGILIGAQPLFVALLASRYAPEERPQGWKGRAGLTLGLLGLILIFGVDLRGGQLALAGGSLVLLAAVCYAGGAIMIHRRHADAPPLGVATSAMLVSTAALAIPTAFSLPAHIPGGRVLAALAVVGVVCTGATLALFYALIVRIGPARAALAFYLSPGFAVTFGAVFLSETITPSAIAGLCAIVVGSLLAAQRTEPTPP